MASRPYQSITACILFTLICSMGLMNFVYEDRPDKLLIFQKSQLAYDTDWLRNNFPSPVRYSAVMLTADNVLTPQIFKMVIFCSLCEEKPNVIFKWRNRTFCRCWNWKSECETSLSKAKCGMKYVSSKAGRGRYKQIHVYYVKLKMIILGCRLPRE